MFERMGSSMSYRNKFSHEDAAENYEGVQYAPDSYDTLLWELERAQLLTVAQQLSSDERAVSYLDFATGTGRVISALESHVAEATGIEISPAMAERARANTRVAKVHCCDITVPSNEAVEKYDLITAFRFILNAEPGLRSAGMRALAERLRDHESVLVFNNHGNLWSCKLLGLPFALLRGRVRPGVSGNIMSHRQVVKLAESAGLTVQRFHGCGLLGARLAKRLPRRFVERVERWAPGSPLRRACVNQMYMARQAAR
jgi:SAM-dependent methyltransferase